MKMREAAVVLLLSPVVEASLRRTNALPQSGQIHFFAFISFSERILDGRAASNNSIISYEKLFCLVRVAKFTFSVQCEHSYHVGNAPFVISSHSGAPD